MFGIGCGGWSFGDRKGNRNVPWFFLEEKTNRPVKNLAVRKVVERNGFQTEISVIFVYFFGICFTFSVIIVLIK